MSRVPICFDGSPLSSGGAVDINSIRQQLNPYYIDQVGDTNVGTISMASGATVTGLSNPVNSTDAADKAYVDTQIATCLTTTTGDVRYLQLAGGLMTGNIAMGNKNITGMANPVNAQDAATKNYADTTFLPLAGGTMSGIITGLPNPTNNFDVANKSYVDTKLSLAGGTVTGNIAMSNKNITGLADPVNAQDAATKSYADAKLTQTSADERYLQLTGGTLTGDVSMDSHRITNLFGGSITNPLDAANMGNINAIVNTICSTQGGTAASCLRADGQTNPSADITMNSHRITNLANPSASTDALNLGTADGKYQAIAKIIRSTQTLGLSSGSPLVSTFTINNSVFTTSSTGQVFLTLYGIDVVDTFTLTVRSVTFSSGSVTIKMNSYRVDSASGWGQNLKVNVLIILD